MPQLLLEQPVGTPTGTSHRNQPVHLRIVLRRSQSHQRTFRMTQDYHRGKTRVVRIPGHPALEIVHVVLEAQLLFLQSGHLARADASLVVPQGRNALPGQAFSRHAQAVVFHLRVVSVAVGRPAARHQDHHRHRPRSGPLRQEQSPPDADAVIDHQFHVFLDACGPATQRRSESHHKQDLSHSFLSLFFPADKCSAFSGRLRRPVPKIIRTFDSQPDRFGIHR